MGKNTVVLTAAVMGILFTGCGPQNSEIEIRPKDQVLMYRADETEAETEKAELTEAAAIGKMTEAAEVSETVVSAESSEEAVTSEKTQDVKKISENNNNSNNSSSAGESRPVTQNSSSQENRETKPAPSAEPSKPAETKASEPVTEAPPTPAAASATSEQKPSDSVSLKYVDGVLIVNKSYPVPEGYKPEGLVLAYGSNEDYILPETNEAFKKLCSGAWSDGYSIYCVSGYRSWETQNRLYTNYCASDGKAAADRYSARPGYSEHHTGLALDVNYPGSAFDSTPEAAWLAENSWKYGFIIRYPKDKEDITGYKYESWHIRYVGTELAAELYSSGLTLEEYFGLDSYYKN